MHALKDNITSQQYGQMAGPQDSHAASLVSSWARGRRRITPWAYPRLRALGVTRLAVGVFLVVLSAVLISRGHGEWVAIPLVFAVLHFAIGGLDMAAAHSAHPRG